ncbi:MAG: V-type ATPase subunit [Spirochaetales bacterium]|nr:V-type ATPase subunit [Spirochaetales bacterium]
MSISALSRYAFINAKLKGRITSMLTSQQIDKLSRSKTLTEALHSLRGTHYEPLIELYHQSGDIERLEAWLFARNIILHQEVNSYLHKGVGEVVAALTRKLEVENLKSVIRLWFSNRIKRQNIDYRYGYLYQGKIICDIDWAKIVNSGTFDEIVESLEETPYGEALARFTTEEVEQEGLFFVETTLDRVWFNLLRLEAKRLPREDRTILKQVLERDADLKNIINLFRFGWLYTLDGEHLKTLMLEGGVITKSEEFQEYLEQPAESRSPMKLIAFRFPDLAEELAASGESSSENLTLTVERYLFKVRRSEYQRMLRGKNPFTIGTVLAYFFLEERQNSVVRTIINGVNYGWEAEAIEEYTL